MQKSAKVALAVSIAAGLACSLNASADDSPAAFQRFVQNAAKATDESRPTYLNSKFHKWAKRKFKVEKLQFDVKKTDSLLNPIVGTVDLEVRYGQTNFADSQADAEGSNDWNEALSPLYHFWYVYAPKDGHWQLSKGTYQGAALPNRFEISDKLLKEEPNSIPAAVTRIWMPAE